MYFQLKSLVLRSGIVSEADKTVVLYTLEWGKVSAVVPGAKKIKARFAAASEPVTETEFQVYLVSPAARPKVTGAKILNSFGDLKKSWINYSIAQSCSEISELLTPFHAENPKKYELLARTWELLSAAKNPWRIYAAFALRFLKLSGYSFIDFLKRENSSLSSGERTIIEQISILSGEDVDNKLDLAPHIENKVRKHLDNYINQYLPRPLSTRRFWNKVSAAQLRG